MSYYSSEVLADAPLAYWRLGDASGTTIADSSGNGRSGTYSGSPTLGVTGALVADADTAITLNGSSQYGSAPATGLDSGATLSVEAWVKGSKSTGDRVIASRWSSSVTTDQRWYLSVSDASNGHVAVFFHDASGYPGVTTTTDVLDGVWHHVVVTFSSGSYVLYVDGVSAGSGSGVGTIQPGGVVNIGRFPGGNYWAGSIDEVAVYGPSLSPTRVAAHYAAGMGSALLAPPAATATALAPAPVIPVGQSVSPPAATATALAPAPAVSTATSATVSPPSATATASAPAPTFTQIIPVGTDATNFLNGRNRRARASVTVTRPVASPPSNLAPRHDKAVPLPPPTLVDGRVT